MSMNKENGPLQSDESAWFIGGKYSHEKLGAGLFYYTPYSIRYWAHDQGTKDTAYGKVNEVVQSIGAPIAVSFFNGGIKIGATLELVHLGIHDSKVLYRDRWGWLDTYQTAEESAAGKKTNVTAYTEPEGEHLAELMAKERGKECQRKTLE